MIAVSQIRLELHEGEQDAVEKACKKIGLPINQCSKGHLSKISVDARRKKVGMVSTVLLETTADDRRLVEKMNSGDVRLVEEKVYSVPAIDGDEKKRPVIVGFGPAGMFCGLVLARAGLKPLILERGTSLKKRVQSVEAFWQDGKLDTETNVQFGEGGAGTFSDGKLTTRIQDPRCGFVLDELIRFGAPPSIRYQAKPHVGTDLLRGVVKSLREEILRLGGDIRFETRVTGFRELNGRIQGVETEKGYIESDHVILAIGHSARDTFEELARKSIEMEVKPFSVGVRIEHLQSEVDKAMYGEFAGHPALPRGEYQLSHRRPDGRAVYTFCMCPGGLVVPSSSEEDTVVVNGMSEFARDGKNANSALVVSVGPKDFGSGMLDGMRFQRELERAAYSHGGGRYRAPAQTAGAFLEKRKGLDLGRIEPSYALDVKPCDMHDLLPAEISLMLEEGLRRFDRKLKGFGKRDAVLTGLETRTSSPLRILRNGDMVSPSLGGLYPCGEGAGYAGGIMSAAVDGMKVAEAVLQTYLRKGF